MTKRMGTKRLGLFAALLLLSAAAMPLNAGAQEPPKKPAPAKAAPAPHPPAPHPVVRAAPRPAPHPVVRAAPPHPVVRAAPPHPVQQRTATPRINPPVNVTPRQVQHAIKPATPAAQIKTPAAQIQKLAKPNTPAVNIQQQAQTPSIAERRAERLRERRVLQSLPPAQRAAKREEFRRERELRVQQGLQAQPNAVRSNSKLSVVRRNGKARVTTQQAQQGRFAAAFASRAQARANALGARIAAHRAWRRGQRAAFVPWYGPVFWPYAYSDVFDYAFWPGGYDDGYWAYAYDDFFDGVFWGEVGPPQAYAYAPAEQAAPSATYAAVQELCKQPGNGVTAWPFADIERKVGLNAGQKKLLDQVRDEAKEAATAFAQSCPADSTFPLTPPGRLQAMTARLDATLQAVQAVRPSLEAFYNSLSDEQKERFNEIGPKTPAQTTAQGGAEPGQQSASACGGTKPGLTNLPIEKIEEVVKPTDAQEVKLNGLEAATARAVSIMQAACPDDTPLTPPGRLEAMETRLKAMIEAANTVKPALNDFYSSLSGEQKARFNTIGKELAQSNG